MQPDQALLQFQQHSDMVIAAHCSDGSILVPAFLQGDAVDGTLITIPSDVVELVRILRIASAVSIQFQRCMDTLPIGSS